MKNFFASTIEFLFDIWPVSIPLGLLVAFFWFILGYLAPYSDHQHWQTRVDFCAAAGGYYTNEKFGDLTVCRSLRDHSVFYVDTNTGARYTITPVSR